MLDFDSKVHGCVNISSNWWLLLTEWYNRPSVYHFCNVFCFCFWLFFSPLFCKCVCQRDVWRNDVFAHHMMHGKWYWYPCFSSWFVDSLSFSGHPCVCMIVKQLLKNFVTANWIHFFFQFAVVFVFLFFVSVFGLSISMFNHKRHCHYIKTWEEWEHPKISRGYGILSTQKAYGYMNIAYYSSNGIMSGVNKNLWP